MQGALELNSRELRDVFRQSRSSKDFIDKAAIDDIRADFDISPQIRENVLNEIKENAQRSVISSNGSVSLGDFSYIWNIKMRPLKDIAADIFKGQFKKKNCAINLSVMPSSSPEVE